MKTQYKKYILFLSFFLITLQQSLQACSVCGMGDPLVSAGDSRPVKGQLRIAVENQILTANAVSDDNPSNREYLEQYTVKPVFVYSPSDILNIVIGIPLSYKNWVLKNSASDNLINRSQPFGLGDIDLGTRIFIFQNVNLSAQLRQAIALSIGLTLPSGNNNAIAYYNSRADEHAQPGTGSIGPYAGLSYAFHRDPWNFSIYAAARYHTINSYDYQYGLGLFAGIGIQFRIWEPLALTFSVDARYALNDTSAGISQINTGGTLLGITPGFILNLINDLWFKGYAQIPVYTLLSGDQVVGATFNFNIEFLFHT